MKGCSVERDCPQSLEGEGSGEAETRWDEKKDLPVRAVIHSCQLLNLFFERFVNKYHGPSLGIYLRVAGWAVLKFRKQEY